MQPYIANINYQDEYKQTILFYVARDGHANLLKTLIEMSIDQNIKDHFNQTAIYYACKNNRLDYA